MYVEIELLRKHGTSLCKIAEQVGCAVNTVRSHLAAETCRIISAPQIGSNSNPILPPTTSAERLDTGPSTRSGCSITASASMPPRPCASQSSSSTISPTAKSAGCPLGTTDDQASRREARAGSHHADCELGARWVCLAWCSVRDAASRLRYRTGLDADAGAAGAGGRVGGGGVGVAPASYRAVADDLVGKPILNFQYVVVRHDDHQRLGKRHHASNGMHGQLLNGPGRNTFRQA